MTVKGVAAWSTALVTNSDVKQRGAFGSRRRGHRAAVRRPSGAPPACSPRPGRGEVSTSQLVLCTHRRRFSILGRARRGSAGPGRRRRRPARRRPAAWPARDAGCAGQPGQRNRGGGLRQSLHADGDELAAPFDQAVGVHDEGVARVQGEVERRALRSLQAGGDEERVLATEKKVLWPSARTISGRGVTGVGQPDRPRFRIDRSRRRR